MDIGELKKFAYKWLMNEKILGEETLEIVGLGSFNSPRLGGAPKAQSMKGEKLSEYRKSVIGCSKCKLHKTRKNLVFGEGNPESPLVFIGEAPGREEDEMGRPFVGEAGKLLTQLLKSIGVERKGVYITNIIKCRPPGNRDPSPEEIDKCHGWLIGQIEIMRPKIICTLGRYATLALIGGLINQAPTLPATRGSLATTFSKIRGRVYEYKVECVDATEEQLITKVIPTYHPAALLYHPKWREAVMQDLKLVKELL